MTDNDKDTWFNNQKYVLEDLKKLNKGQEQIFQKIEKMDDKIDNLKSEMNLHMVDQKNVCMNKSVDCNNRFVPQKIFTIFMSILLAVLLGIGGVIYSNSRNISEHEIKIQKLEEKHPVKTRDFYNEKTGTKTYIEYFDKNQ